MFPFAGLEGLCSGAMLVVGRGNFFFLTNFATGNMCSKEILCPFFPSKAEAAALSRPRSCAKNAQIHHELNCWFGLVVWVFLITLYFDQ